MKIVLKFFMPTVISLGTIYGQIDKEATTSNNINLTMEINSELKNESGNLIYSPLSITSAMAMVYTGSGEKTKSQIGKVFSFPETEDFPKSYGDFLKKLQNSEPKLEIANALVLMGLPPSETYQNLLKEDFDSEVFSGDAEQINKWVAKRTYGKIEKIVDQLSPDLACVLLNAVYFKGKWLRPFDPTWTEELPFYLTDGAKIQTPTMNIEAPFRLHQGETFDALMLPYQSLKGSFSMVIAIPKEKAGIENLEKSIDENSLNALIGSLNEREEQDVKVYLPKFKFEKTLSLVPYLQKLGIEDSFEPGIANFSNMGYPIGEVWIAEILHKTIVEVDEEGTEAASVTAVMMMATGMPMEKPPVPKFRADRPFLFWIIDNQNKTVLFSGRLNNPKN